MKWMLILPSYGPAGTMWNHVATSDGVVKLFPSKRAAEEYRKINCNVPSVLRSVRVTVGIERRDLPKNRWKPKP
jgi:hypothetical protein